MKTTVSIGDAYTFEPSCALFAEAATGNNLKRMHRIRVTGAVDYINAAHRWFRVRYRLNGIPNDQFKCFQIPTTESLPFKQGHRWNGETRTRNDTRYNTK